MSNGCKADVRPQICGVTSAEAAMALGKEVSGEIASQLVSEAQREQTHGVAGHALAIVGPALEELARHKRDIADLVTAAGGAAAVSAAVARAEAHQAYLRSYGEQRAATFAEIEARYVAGLKTEEGVKVGDTFRVVAHAGLPAGSVGEVVELYPLGCVGITGPGWRLTTSAQVLLGPGWKLVRAVEAPPVRAEVGDRFEALCAGFGFRVGETVTVDRLDVTDGFGDRWLVGPRGDSALETVENLRDPKLYRPLPPLPAAATTEGETSDLDGPAGDELPFANQREDRRAQAHAARVAAAGWRDDVSTLLRAWQEHTLHGMLAEDVDEAIAKLARRAGLLLPSKLPVPA